MDDTEADRRGRAPGKLDGGRWSWNFTFFFFFPPYSVFEFCCVSSTYGTSGFGLSRVQALGSRMWPGTIFSGTGEAHTGSRSGCDSVCGSTFLLPNEEWPLPPSHWEGRGAYEAQPVSPTCSPTPCWVLWGERPQAGSPSGVLGRRWQADPLPLSTVGEGHGFQGMERGWRRTAESPSSLPEGTGSTETQVASGPLCCLGCDSPLRPGLGGLIGT